MRRRDFIIRWLVVLPMVVAWLFVGCSKEKLTDDGEEDSFVEEVPVIVKLNLSVSIADGAGGLTRAGEGELITPGTTDESSVRSLTVFIVSVDEQGNETKRADYATFTVNWNGSDVFLQNEIKMATTTGKKHIYIGANLSQRQIAAFAGENGNGVNEAYTATEKDGYEEMISEFATEGSFTMMGQATGDEGELIVITPDNITNSDQEHPLNLVVKLSRMVAKVLVVAETEERMVEQGGESGVKYVKVSSSSGQSDFWVRLSDMYFSLNITNRRVFLQQKKNKEGTIIDPNYKFEDLIELKEGVFGYKGGDRPFVSWIPDIRNDDKKASQVYEYDASKMPSSTNQVNVYTEGAYCLENSVGDIPTEWSAIVGGEPEKVTFMATTYVVIAAKIIPRCIFLPKGGEEKGVELYQAKNENEAWSKLQEDFENPGKYPQGTFYTPDRKNFYSYQGMKARIEHDNSLPEGTPDKLTRENFMAFPGGWGYYFTYVDGEPNEANENNTLKFSSGRSGVLRNWYYILHIKKLGAPPFPGEEGLSKMEIEVKRFGWKDAGSGDITLKP